MRKILYGACLALFMASTGCIHTSRISNLYNYGVRLDGDDVILFTGFNGEHSQTSEIMLDQTKRILKKYGVEAHYLHKTDFNYEFVKAGFLAADLDVDNDRFINNMVEVYGLTYIFNVGHVSQYQGETMPVSRAAALDDQSGIVFEVYSVEEEKVMASMRLTGSTIHFVSINEPEDRYYGNIYKNYGKGLRKLMKASKY